MSFISIQEKRVNPASRMEEIGGFITHGGIVVIDQDVGESFKWIHIAIGGDLFVEGSYNQNNGTGPNIIPFIGLSSDSWVHVIGRRVLSVSPLGNTTASGITWYGGE